MPRRPLILASLLAALAAPSVLAQAPDRAERQPDLARPDSTTKESLITATGTARVERTPDYVDVMLGAVATDKSASEAHAAAAKTMDAAVAAIRALKLEGEDLQTGSVDLQPRYERRDNANPDLPPRIVGYTGSNTLRVRTADLKAVPRIIDTALAAGCNRVDYVQFGIKEAIAAREEAVKLATQAARRKAAVMAEALELRLTRVVEANTTSNQWGGWYGGNRMAQMANSALGAQAEGSGESVVPGKIEVWADATLKYAATSR